MPATDRSFNYDLDYQTLDLRQQPELYRVGRGEMGVLLVQPYKSEILPHWRFKTPEIARESSEKIYQLFLDYKANGDFIGMDMARKFLQMGMTRSLRYYHHKSGKKYVGPVPEDKKGQSGAHGRETAPEERDIEKKVCADIFRNKYLEVMADEAYLQLRDKFKQEYG
ncbi:DUF4385 domain-containing protein [Spirosoma utsteinense]|uniref:Cytoplasmic protein n=1 Tax=Spirosoma utsteinense TaxID=2585773 RepID=A0ABR6W6B0_9BACT|nr:DUF4385 domain-containing protein [Spirosoma utsteinense]MBC3788275.1 hypothetical protein [Spirosoma utsteinense]MBC3792126.1 hypothetical protein [Spirosoma utsteinense]